MTQHEETLAEIARLMNEPDTLEGFGWDGAYRIPGANGIADVTGVEVEGDRAEMHPHNRLESEPAWTTGLVPGIAFLLSACLNHAAVLGMLLLGTLA